MNQSSKMCYKDKKRHIHTPKLLIFDNPLCTLALFCYIVINLKVIKNQFIVLQMTTVLFVALVATVQAPAGILADVKVGCSKITLTLITSVPEVFKLKRGD